MTPISVSGLRISAADVGQIWIPEKRAVKLASGPPRPLPETSAERLAA